MRSSWTRQLLFTQDPARFRKSADGVVSVLMQEYDPQHTAEAITASLSEISLRPVLDKYHAEVSLRLFSLVGSCSQRFKIQIDPADLPIENKLYKRPPSSGSQEEPYFGLEPGSYVHM